MKSKFEIIELLENTYQEALTEAVSRNALRSYLETAMWSSDMDGELDDKDVRDIDKGSLNKAKKDLTAFFRMAKKLLADEGKDDGEVAHDFFLTRNGHGAGFWDGDYENGDELTKIAEKFRNVEVYVGDDGKVYMD